MFNPASASKKIKEDFIDYLTTSFKTCNDNYNTQFKNCLMKEISKGPYVEISDIFKSGLSLESLIKEGVLSHRFEQLEAKKPSNYEIDVPLSRPLFKHQEEALRKANDGRNLIITTGTGSGKTESFLYPVLNEIFKEQDAGTLTKSGVRAILIYPMNALANDQIKRIRNILMFYPDISFGVFTGDTIQERTPALNKYRENHKNEKYQELRNGLINERLSRNDMYENPPHILITNYVMLEYLLLRPDYSGVFQNSDLKFIVLDESHVYRGATGIETSMLLRKLKARLGKTDTGIQYILTSATLGKKGESEEEIASFGCQLTNENFESEDIIFGERVNFELNKDNNLDVDLNVWKALADEEQEENIKTIFLKFKINYDDKKSADENVYDLCCASKMYSEIRKCYSEPTEIESLSNALKVSVDCMVSFLFVCSKAIKNGFPLVDIHYHFFTRALEGVYVTLSGNKELFLDRIDHVDNDDGSTDKVFEIARCNACGDLAIIGNKKKNPIDNKDYLYMQNSPFEKGSQELNDFCYFHIVRAEGEDNEFVDFGDQEEELDINESKKNRKSEKINGYWLCPHCGQILAGKKGKPKCGHPEKDMIKLVEIDGEDRCLFCSEGNYSGFYIGSDGATSVLGMSLFESLPSKKCSINENGTKIEFDGGKQFLCFSDSRSEAAYFACYEKRIYETFISRRGLAQYINSISDEIRNNELGYVTLIDVVNGLSKLFRDSYTFSDYLSDHTASMESTNIAKKYAWMVVLDQLVGYNRKNYLQPMGYFQFVYRGITDDMVEFVKTKYLPTKDSQTIAGFLSTLAMSFARCGAIIHEGLGIDNEVLQYVFKSSVQNCILEQKTSGEGTHNQSWIPQNLTGQSDKWHRSARQDLVKRVLNCDGKTANDFLIEMWRNYFVNPQHPFHAQPVGKIGGFAMPLNAFAVIVSGHELAHWYKCDCCGKIFNYNIDGKCQVKNCKGHLTEIDNPKEYFSNNYYKKAYDTNYLRKLLIKEHTAQLGRDKGSDYQEEFALNKINALSCSTTFEMGVNLGRLETVFLRDMPPTAANYIQRAGRAGRSKEASAFAMTYAKLSSHDFNYFKDPKQMISGRINPPLLKENNEKIVYRHIFSVVLSYFFSLDENQCFFDSANNQNTIGAFIDKTNGSSGYERFVLLLKDKPKGLTAILKTSFGDNLENLYRISSYGEGIETGKGWVDVLIGENGRLSGAIKIIEETLEVMHTEIMKIQNAVFVNQTELTETESNRISKINRRREFLKSKQIVDFLVECNVLPKYGFPVDTVDLKLNGSKKELSLSRDMSKAISEYAPGSKIIADGKMYTSRYIAKVMRAGKIGFDDGYYCQCGDPNCRTPNFIFDDLPGTKCIGCHNTLAGVNKIKAIQPSAGMISEFESKDVPSKKPEKLYSSEASYVGSFTDDAKRTYSVNDKLVTVISTENDMIMVNTDPNHPFYVCMKCGYAVGKFDSAYKLDDNGHFKKDTSETKKLNAGQTNTIQCSHNEPNGNRCTETTLEKRILVHTFNTDIVQIIFNDQIFELENTSIGNVSVTGISVLNALINAVSNVLQIEEEDIDGCIIKNTSSECSNFRFVLYDNVPGGAGHVKRIVEKDGKILECIITRALEKMECECDSSCYKCLKTYRNQRYHSVLSHFAAKSFLENYRGTFSLVEKHNNNSVAHLNFSNNGLTINDINSLLQVCSHFMCEKAYESICGIIEKYPPDSNNVNSDVLAFGTSGKVLLKWPNEKVLLLTKNEKKFFDIVKDKCDWNVFIPDESFDVLSFEKIFNK